MPGTYRLVAALLAASLAPAAAWAQAAPAPAAVTEGRTVIDKEGAEVGTVVKVQGDLVTVRTDKHDAVLPRISLALTGGRLQLGMTQQQLNKAVERRLAGEPAVLEGGATVIRSDGSPVGPITDIARYVSIRLASGKIFQVFREKLSPAPNGILLDDATAGELDMLTGGAKSN